MQPVCNALQHPFLDLNRAGVPVPNGLIFLPRTQPFIPMIVATLINELQSKANASPGRCVLFNVMANMNYSNEHFRDLVQFTISLSEITVVQTQGDFQQIVNKFALDVCSAFIGYVMEPGLQSHVQANPAIQGMLGLLRQAKQTFDQYRTAVQQHLQSLRQSMSGGNANYGQQQNTGYGGMGFNTPPNAGVQAYQAAIPTANSYAGVGGNGGMNMDYSAMMNGGSIGAPAIDPEIERLNRHVDNRSRLLDQNPEVVQTVAVSSYGETVPEVNPFDTDVTTNVEVTEMNQSAPPGVKNWSPINGPLIAFNPNITVERFEFYNGTDKTIQILETIPVDEQRHRLPTFVKPRMAEKIIFDNQRTLAVLPSEYPEPTPLFTDETITESVTSTLWTSLEQQLATLTENNVIVQPVVLADPFLTQYGDEHTFFDLMHQLTDLESFHKFLTNTVNSNANIRDTLIDLVNKRVVNYVNSFMHQSMGLEVRITDFIADWQELKDHLLTDFNEVFHNVLVRPTYSNLVHELACDSSDVESTSGITQAYTDAMREEYGNDENVRFFITEINLAMTSLNSFELGIDVQQNYSYALSSAHSPFLIELMEKILEPEDMKPTVYRKTILRTMDGYQFEIVRSPSTRGTFMIELKPVEL